jgi:epidermal growth factor receptor substrate 15
METKHHPCIVSSHYTIDAPLPHFEGITTGDTPAASISTPIAAQNTGSDPPLTNEDRTKYGGMFVACGPVNGLLDGDKAREVFLKSKLPVETLSQIWYVVG